MCVQGPHLTCVLSVKVLRKLQPLFSLCFQRKLYALTGDSESSLYHFYSLSQRDEAFGGLDSRGDLGHIF